MDGLVRWDTAPFTHAHAHTRTHHVARHAHARVALVVEEGVGGEALAQLAEGGVRVRVHVPDLEGIL